MTPRDHLRRLIEADRAQLQPTVESAANTWDHITHSVWNGASPPFDLPPANTGIEAAVSAPASTGVAMGALMLVGSLVIGASIAVSLAPPATDRGVAPPAAVQTRHEPSTPPRVAVTPPVVEPRAARPLGPRPRRHRPRRGSAVSSDELARALALIAKAQRTLSAGHPERTLSLLRDRAACPDSLREDCRALRTLAECALGRDRALEHGRRFLGRYPHSIYADRVEDTCRNDA